LPLVYPDTPVPCPAVPLGDARADLVGELGARAVRFIAAGTLLGPYATYVCTRSEFKARRFQAVPGPPRAMQPGGVSHSHH